MGVEKFNDFKICIWFFLVVHSMSKALFFSNKFDGFISCLLLCMIIYLQYVLDLCFFGPYMVYINESGTKRSFGQEHEMKMILGNKGSQ